MHKIILALLLVSLSAPLLVWAGDADAPTPIPDASQTSLGQGPKGILVILNTIVDWIFTILLVLAVLFIILAAFNYLTSGGNEEKIRTATRMLLFTVIAVAVALIARGILFLIQLLVAPHSPPVG